MIDRLEEFKIYINEEIELTRNLIDREYKISGMTNHVLDLLKEVEEWNETLFHTGMFEDKEQDHDWHRKILQLTKSVH